MVIEHFLIMVLVGVVVGLIIVILSMLPGKAASRRALEEARRKARRADTERRALLFRVMVLEAYLTNTGHHPVGTTKGGWRSVLGLPASGPITRDQIKAAYRRQAKALHPDHGGSVAAMASLNLARTAAMKAVN
jgi:hypothetical protein